MKRRLAQFAADCGGTLQGEDREFSGVSTDTRTLARGELFVALRGPRFDGADFVAQAQAAGAAGAVVAAGAPPRWPRRARTAARCRRSWWPTRSRAAAGGATPGAALRDPGDRRRRQQRQDHLQGNDRRDPRAGRPGARDPRQPQQPHRRAADAAAPRAGAPPRRDRDGRQPRRRGRRADALRASRTSASSPTRAPSTSRASAVSRAWRAPRARLFAGARAGRHRRSSTPTTSSRRCGASMTRARVVTFGLAPRRGLPRRRASQTSVGQRRLPDTIRPDLATGAYADRAQAGGHAQRRQCARRRRRGGRGRRHDSTQVAAGLAAMRAVPGRLQFRTARSGAWVIDDSYNANPSSVRAGIDVLAGLDGPPLAGDRRHGRARRVRRGRARRDRPLRARARHRAPVRDRQLAGIAVEAFGAGARWFPDGDRWRARSSAELTRRGARADQGLAHEPARARRRGRRATARRRDRHGFRDEDSLTMLLLAGQATRRRPDLLQCVHLPDAARDPRGDVGARDRAADRPVDDRAAVARPDRPGGARRRPAVAPEEGRHADHGRRADPGRDRRGDAAVGRPAQPLRLGGARRDAGLRRRRLRATTT